MGHPVGFVGNGADKFTRYGRKRAISTILQIMELEKPTMMVSGHSPVGGIDIWAESCAKLLGIPLDLKIPVVEQWNPPGQYGYKARNLDIAADSNKLYVILADSYPPGYSGMKFDLCYHCNRTDHVKSGGCWTGIQAKKLGKVVQWIVIPN